MRERKRTWNFHISAGGVHRRTCILRLLRCTVNKQAAGYCLLPFLCSTTSEPCWNMQGLSSSEQHMSCLFLRHEFLMEHLEAFPLLHRNTHKHTQINTQLCCETSAVLLYMSTVIYREGNIAIAYSRTQRCVLMEAKTHPPLHRGKTQHQVFLQVFWLQEQ